MYIGINIISNEPACGYYTLIIKGTNRKHFSVRVVTFIRYIRVSIRFILSYIPANPFKLSITRELFSHNKIFYFTLVIISFLVLKSFDWGFYYDLLLYVWSTGLNFSWEGFARYLQNSSSYNIVALEEINQYNGFNKVIDKSPKFFNPRCELIWNERLHWATSVEYAEVSTLTLIKRTFWTNVHIFAAIWYFDLLG